MINLLRLLVCFGYMRGRSTGLGVTGVTRRYRNYYQFCALGAGYLTTLDSGSSFVK